MGTDENDILQLAEDISVAQTPLRHPSPNSPHILVIGGGVTGLVTSWLLLDRGYIVTIVSKEWASYGLRQRLTSQISGALWELPPTECGGVNAVEQKLNDGDLKTVQEWAQESFKIYAKLAQNEEVARASGVKLCTCTSFQTYRLLDDELKFRKMELARKISPDGFQWGLDLARKYGVNTSAFGGLKDAYEHLAPVIDTDMAMSFLMRLVRVKGASFYTDTIVGNLIDQEAHLLRIYQADAIVNATGMAGELASDKEVYPLRGGVLRVINDGSDFPKIESSLIVAADRKDDGTYGDVAFVVPRSDNILILGSIEQAHEWDLDLKIDSPIIQKMRERCEELVPALKQARLDPRYPLAQGLRPYRNSRIRVEREGHAKNGHQSRIVHCYGHGGAGWSLAFGSSRECVRLIEETIERTKGRDIRASL
ncbi:hypothetical protein N7478_009194 [Penicillium angulare]|uniref:uncharacterized protein n=1 Tax=Penicillium angulare TaxID=116970 RepID=UPI002540FCC0|nr:uncharacterized protein N7478_009194 [Penicillium angulare]KAJ5274069.1 hypothetical protein N7478_009194 [Penicillium angulare]